MTNIIWLYEGPMEHFDKFKEDFANRFYDNGKGRARTYEVKLMVTKVNGKYAERFKEDLASFFNYPYDSKDDFHPDGTRVPAGKFKYGGFNWRGLGFLRTLLLPFVYWLGLRKYVNPKKSSGFVAAQARLGRHYNAHAIPLFTVPDDVRQGVEQV